MPSAKPGMALAMDNRQNDNRTDHDNNPWKPKYTFTQF